MSVFFRAGAQSKMQALISISAPAPAANPATATPRKKSRPAVQLYDVPISDGGFAVKRNGQPLFAADQRVEIRQVEFRRNRVRGEVRFKEAGTLRVGTDPVRPFGIGVTRFAKRLGVPRRDARCLLTISPASNPHQTQPSIIQMERNKW